jgi:hypothetical protein
MKTINTPLTVRPGRLADRLRHAIAVSAVIYSRSSAADLLENDRG